MIDAVPIDYQRLRNITARELENVLFQDGFLVRKSKSSHRNYQHEATKRRVTIAWHGPGQTFVMSTLRRIIDDQAQWTQADLIRLGLIRD